MIHFENNANNVRFDGGKGPVGNRVQAQDVRSEVKSKKSTSYLDDWCI